MADDRLDTLKKKRDQLNAQIAKLNARKASGQRRLDTRRKIVAGAVLLDAVAADLAAEKPTGIAGWWEQQRAKLARPQDRALFEHDGSSQATGQRRNA